MKPLSRRQFLQGAATAAAAILASGIARATSGQTGASTVLTDGWQGLRMPLAGPWEAWMDPPLAPWTALTLPHCFNAGEACDPDTPAYRGRFWYRRHLAIANPYAGGRTLLHFEAAGQSAEIYIGSRLAASYIGGYDEFVVDITDAAADPANRDPSGTRLAVLCDNAPDLERMPSDLSDFTLYGGLYRNVHLVYVPPGFACDGACRRSRRRGQTCGDPGARAALQPFRADGLGQCNRHGD